MTWEEVFNMRRYQRNMIKVKKNRVKNVWNKTYVQIIEDKRN